MNARTRTALAVLLALSAAAFPVTQAAVASTAPPSPSRCTSAADPGGLDTAALCAALGSLPDSDTTAALVRVGGTDGTWRGSAGVHDLDTGRPADPRGRFRAGSVTKVFTAAVVLQLAAERKVDLGAPARRYLPALVPAAYGDVTVRQLLDHTSGIPGADMPGGTVEEAYAHRFDLHPPESMVENATAKAPEFAPGTKQHYLNINYTVLGLLIEKVTGRPYAEEVGRRVLRPLRLRDTSYPGTDPRIEGPHNHGYQRFAHADGTTELRDVTIWGQTESWAAGDIISTTADLERFLRALFTGRVVPRPQLEEMFTLPAASVREYGSGAPASYSAGLSVITLGGREVWGKTGSRYGYTSAIAATRDLSRTMVLDVGATDAKGEDMNSTELALIVAAFGAPSA
ncbi:MULTISPECIES: serine hydrolase domain-containing protein [unclassified Streptomyces]|uniref:serine hydrolase domain-containing protein n=1 Tax=unclassified Streptomyces TaxID=2593676 RepID=UPI0003803914|nr:MULTISPECIES: serine hydrolase domain-containing protein [unclassified Streptomyces]MYX32945.1 serine hydrolase [Streptomyces sp. SID8377]